MQIYSVRLVFRKVGRIFNFSDVVVVSARTCKHGTFAYYRGARLNVVGNGKTVIVGTGCFFEQFAHKGSIAGRNLGKSENAYHVEYFFKHGNNDKHYHYSDNTAQKRQHDAYNEIVALENGQKHKIANYPAQRGNNSEYKSHIDVHYTTVMLAQNVGCVNGCNDASQQQINALIADKKLFLFQSEIDDLDKVHHYHGKVGEESEFARDDEGNDKRAKRERSDVQSELPVAVQHEQNTVAQQHSDVQSQYFARFGHRLLVGKETVQSNASQQQQYTAHFHQ